MAHLVQRSSRQSIFWEVSVLDPQNASKRELFLTENVLVLLAPPCMNFVELKSFHFSTNRLPPEYTWYGPTTTVRMQTNRPCLASTLTGVTPRKPSKLSFQEWTRQRQPIRLQRPQWPQDGPPQGFNWVLAFSPSPWRQFWVSLWNEETRVSEYHEEWFSLDLCLLFGFNLLLFAELSDWLKIQACDELWPITEL